MHSGAIHGTVGAVRDEGLLSTSCLQFDELRAGALQALALTINGKAWECLSGASQRVEVRGASCSRVRGILPVGCLRGGHNGRAVDEVVRIVTKDSQLSHGCLEGCSHELLLVHEALPEASSAVVASEGEVRLETKLADVCAA